MSCLPHHVDAAFWLSRLRHERIAGGEYRLFNWLSWRAGYTVLWLGGVANAANQLARSDFAVNPPAAGVSPYSSVLLHGATTGLEARW